MVGFWIGRLRRGGAGRLPGELMLAVLLCLSTGCAKAIDMRGGEDAADVVVDVPSDASDVAADPGADETGGSGDPAVDAPPDRSPALPLLHEVGDWPDCFGESECPGYSHDFSGFTIALDPETGDILYEGERYGALRGTIEEPAGHPFGYDADLIGVRVPARTVVVITVEPDPAAGLIDPHVATFDAGRLGDVEPGFREISANGQRAPGDRSARTTIAAPYSDTPFFVWIDDQRNWLGEGPVGGANYGYRASFATAPFAPVEIDVSGGSVSRAGESDLALAGDVHYYRFRPPTSGWRVTFDTETPGFIGAVIGFDTRGGDLRPYHLAGDEAGATPVVLPGEGFVTDAGEHIFSVTDWFGRGTNVAGVPFNYTLTVEPEL